MSHKRVIAIAVALSYGYVIGESIKWLTARLTEWSERDDDT